MLPDPGHESMGSTVAIANGVSAGGIGREAAQTTVTSLVRDYYATPMKAASMVSWPACTLLTENWS